MADQDRTERPSMMRQALPIYYALLLAILTVVAIQMLFWLEHLLLLMFISIVFAATIARPASALERLRIPRFIAALIVYAVVIGILSVMAWYLLPPLFGQIAQFSSDIPLWVDRFEGLQEWYEEVRVEYPTLEALDDQVQGAAGRIAGWAANQLTLLPQVIFQLIFDAISVFFISLLIVTSRDRIMNLILSMVSPVHRETTRAVLTKMWVRVGFYLQAKLIVMAIVGVLMFTALWFIDVRFPLLLAIVVAVAQLLPRIGPWLGRVPLIGIAALDGWTTVILVIAASVIIENLKGYVISPLVEGDQLDIHPLLVFIAVLAGGTLFGLAGAFVAVPAAAMIQVLFEEVILPWRKRQMGESDDVHGEARIDREIAVEPATNQPS